MRIYSGAQSGVDCAALEAAKEVGLETGGTMPKGFLTLDGCKPEYKERFNIVEHSSPQYAPRTFENVKNSDATLRIAKNFSSPGEICTKKAINKYDKPSLDINTGNPLQPEEVVNWLIDSKIEVLNVAGNSEQTCPGIFQATKNYLKKVFQLYKERQEYENYSN